MNTIAPPALTTSQKTAIEWLRAGRSCLTHPAGRASGWQAQSPDGTRFVRLTDTSMRELLDARLIREVPDGSGDWPEFEPVCTPVVDMVAAGGSHAFGADPTHVYVDGPGGAWTGSVGASATTYVAWLTARPDLLEALPSLRGKVLVHSGAPWDGLGALPDPPAPAHVLARMADGLDPFPPGQSPVKS